MEIKIKNFLGRERFQWLGGMLTNYLFLFGLIFIKLYKDFLFQVNLYKKLWPFVFVLLTSERARVF